MPGRSAHHASFVIERTYDAPPGRVFVAWAEPAAKARWFVGPDEWESSGHELDFRVGGRERVSGGPKGGPVRSYEARYQDSVPDQRIVYSYDMHLDKQRMLVSLSTVEFAPAGAGTRLKYTEQAVFLDGADTAAGRGEGTKALLDSLGAALRRARASAQFFVAR